MGEYAKELRARQPRAAVRRRLRTVRAFSRFLAPRSLDEALPEDLSEWALTQVDDSERAERRAELADFYQWHRSGAGVAAAGQDGNGARPGPVAVGTAGAELLAEAASEQHDPVDQLVRTSVDDRRARAREPVRVRVRPPRAKSRYSWPKRLAVALLLGLVTVLWMVTLIIPDRRTGLKTTTTELGRTRPTVTTTAPMHPRGEVTVLTFNASGVPTRGDDMIAGLTKAGYRIVPAAQAPAPLPTSTVYWTPGYEREARALANALQVPVEIAAAPLPEPPPVPDLMQANLVVVVGQDLAH